MSSKKSSKQAEFNETPSPEIRNKVLEALELKDEIGGKHKQFKGIQDDIRKMLRADGKKSLTIQDDEGESVTVRLVPTGERVTISATKPSKKHAVPD